MSFTETAARLAGRVALLLGWRPAEFWAATPTELAVILRALDAGDAAAVPDADTLAALRRRFPD